MTDPASRPTRLHRGTRNDESQDDRDRETRDAADLRMPVLGAAAWAGALAGLVGPGWLLPTGLVGVVAVGALLTRRSGPRDARAEVLAMLVAVLIVGGGVGVVAALQAEQLSSGPVARLAQEQAAGRFTAVLTSDPRVHQGRHGDFVTVRVSLREITARGGRWQVRRPVLVIGGLTWSQVPLGATVSGVGRLQPAEDDLAAVVSARGEPTVIEHPGRLLDAAEAVRSSIRAAVQERPHDQRALIPALVTGDESGLSDDLRDDFATTGLTHLLAVSGSNLVIVVGYLVILARWAGVSGRGLTAVGLIGIAGFVLLARTEPSVVRAAAMGAVALIGMGRNGRQRGTRALGVAVVAVLLADPWMAVSAGFALSALATAGILFLGPGLRDALMAWLPRWCAEAVAVPTAAQLACTPVVVALAGEVSLVAVFANLLAAPAVPPATVLGLVAGLVGLVWPALAGLLGAAAGWSASWIIVVARRGAALPGAAIDWGAGAGWLVVLVVLTVVTALLAPRLLRRRWLAIGASLLLALVVAGPVSPGRLYLPFAGGDWPPAGWLLVVCDVGQGDALVLPAGPGAAVVIDAGPDPDAVDGCLGRLGVRRVPLVVLTHFHADHVAGLSGVLDGREVAEIDVTTLRDPVAGASRVRDDAESVPVEAAATDSVRSFGGTTVQVLWPVPGPAVDNANDSSVVLLAEVDGVRLLLSGDVEPPAQRSIAARFPGLTVDVLKVPHHGSRYQDPDWITSLRATVAVVSAGEGNDYGHPAPQTLDLLEGAGAEVGRTDRSGDLAVVRGTEGITVVGRD